MKDKVKLVNHHDILTGAFAVIENLTSEIRCIGWAIDPYSNLPAKEVIVMDGERILGRGKCAIERKDVVEYIGCSSVTKFGWEIYINKKCDYGIKIKSIRIYIRARSG